MSDYLSVTPRERAAMCAALGITDVSELYADVPRELRRCRTYLSDGRSQQEVSEIFKELASRNKRYDSVLRGAGSYRHYIPSAVKSITAREEFVTAYTPYQAEMSQGILQAMFEYQTMICNLTGMDAATVSHYSGATAAAEACLMFAHRGDTAVIYDNVNPDTYDTVATYLAARGAEMRTLRARGGRADVSDGELNGASVVYVESPNYYGLLEDLSSIAASCAAVDAKLVVGCNPMSLALFKPPSEYGADAVVGDGQPFGMPLSFGGPYLGYMAVKKEYMRRLPGRIVGETADAEGRRAYVLTLQAREQHIRRERATSNICSNQALCALTASVYMSLLGPDGLRETAEACASNAHYFARKLQAAGLKLFYEGEFFHEFVTFAPNMSGKILTALDEAGILGGLALDGHRILWCCTELNTKADMDRAAEITEAVYADGV